MSHPEKLALLGYDARHIPERLAALWDGARRETYLLRQDVVAPLSTDTLVWPSVFDSGQGIGMSIQWRKENLQDGLPLPDWTGPLMDTWEDPAALQNWLVAHQVDSAQYQTIAITLHAAPGQQAFHVPTEEAMLSPPWRLLGHDVADPWMLSGLCDCGYTPEEMGPLRAKYGPRLNEHHLFTSLEVAQEFRVLSDEQVREHAPFYVYGLWRQEPIGQVTVRS